MITGMTVDDITGIQENWSMTVYSCPNCQNAYILDGFKFCPMCGIGIMWENPLDADQLIRWPIKGNAK